MNRLILPLMAVSLVACGGGSSGSGDAVTPDHDATAPTLTHEMTASAVTAETRYPITFRSSEAGTLTVEGDGCQANVRSGGVAVVAGENSTSLTVSAESGQYQCSIRVTDGAGNVSDALMLPLVTIDLTAPELSHDMAAIGNTIQTRHTIRFSTTEAGAVAVSGDGCQLGITPVDAQVGHNDIALLVDSGVAEYQCALTVTDAVGNVSASLPLPLINVVSLDTRLTLFIGEQDTLIEVPELPLSYEFYRSQQEDCDLVNYANCEQGQLDIIEGATQLTDSALMAINADDQQQPAKTAYYTLKTEGKIAQVSVDVRTGWGGRSTWDMTPLNLNGQLFLFNGLFQSKIWTSTDAINWSEITDHNFENRVYTDATVFNDRIWVLGGRQGNNRSGDVWSSADGKTWRKHLHSAAFGSREFHQLVTFNNALYLIGGRTQVNGSARDKRDVWKSEDGVNWTLLSADTGMSNTLYDHQALAIDNDGIYVFYNNHYQSNPRLVEVWKSNDGISWTKLSELPHRTDFSVAHLNGKFIVVGGLDADGGVRSVLTSSDAITWQETPASGYFEAFKNSGIVEFNDRLWRYGGLSETSGGTNVIKSSADGIHWRIPQTVDFNFELKR